MYGTRKHRYGGVFSQLLVVGSFITYDTICRTGIDMLHPVCRYGTASCQTGTRTILDLDPRLGWNLERCTVQL